jgi:hypothetical protein
MRAARVSKKLNFGVSDLVRHRLHAEHLGIIIEIDTGSVTATQRFGGAYHAPTVRVLWGGGRLTWNFFSSLVRCNLPRTVV